MSFLGYVYQLRVWRSRQLSDWPELQEHVKEVKLLWRIVCPGRHSLQTKRTLYDQRSKYEFYRSL